MIKQVPFWGRCLTDRCTPRFFCAQRCQNPFWQQILLLESRIRAAETIMHGSLKCITDWSSDFVPIKTSAPDGKQIRTHCFSGAALHHRCCLISTNTRSPMPLWEPPAFTSDTGICWSLIPAWNRFSLHPFTLVKATNRIYMVSRQRNRPTTMHRSSVLPNAKVYRRYSD